MIAAVTGFAEKIPAVLKADPVPHTLFAELKAVAELLQEDYTPSEADEILSCPEISAIKSGLPGLVAKMETELEKAEARRQVAILEAAGVAGLDQFILYDKYKNLVRKEWQLYRQFYTEAELRQMRFAFAGCGAMPMTAIGMAHVFGVSVDCYDVDEGAYQLADRIVSLSGVQGKIGVYHGNALDIDYSRYDVVIVANLAQPQMEILGNIARHGNVRAVIVRQVTGLVSLLYSSFERSGLQGLRLAGAADPHDKKSVHQSVILAPV